MSPTVFREGPYRFFFFSREEPRMHVHAPNGEAKFWMEPTIELAESIGLKTRELNRSLKLVQGHEREIREAWQTHFGG